MKDDVQMSLPGVLVGYLVKLKPLSSKGQRESWAAVLPGGQKRVFRSKSGAVSYIKRNGYEVIRDDSRVPF